MPAQNAGLGIVVNPMSGRDVRRVAARASTSQHHEKQQQVTRLRLHPPADLLEPMVARMRREGGHEHKQK